MLTRRYLAALIVALPTVVVTPLVTMADWPNGPTEDPQLAPPNDPGFKGQWNLWSFVPDEWVANNPGFREAEIKMGTGIHADRAWQRTTGDRRVIIAVLDSGIRWDSGDLINKHYLNKGELENYKPTKGPGSIDDWDTNGDGAFSIKDYLYADPNFGVGKDLNKNGKFDPGDLIGLASDGKDDDGNGYVDDISGWDFMWNDNDPFDDTDFGHGTGEARDSASEGNNGEGDIGVCPNCTILNMRVGDSFVVEVNDFAEAVIYATDNGAHVIQEALGSINNTAYSHQAIEYAYANNVVIIASAADELSFHHNFPGTNNHTVYVHAIVYDGNKPSTSTTFLNFNNCTNFGGQLVLSTPGTGCSSEATGITSGHAGLIYSAAVQSNLQPPLTAEEVRGILIMSADDIDVPESVTDTTKFPSGPGWDLHFGYGRNNARTSVDMVLDNWIPPEVDVIKPLWFETIYVERTPQVDVVGRIGNRVDGLPPRYESYSYTVEYALGVDPKGGWVEITSGNTTGLDGKIATWDAKAASDALDFTKPLKDPHQHAVTIRVIVTAKTAEGKDVKGEFRKTWFLHKDSDLHDNFPLYLGTSGESSPKFADIDSDGKEELIIGTSDGHIHAFKVDGSEALGWPVQLGYRPSLDPDNQSSAPWFGLGNHRLACAYREDKTGCVRVNGKVDPDVGQTMIGTVAIGDLTGDSTDEQNDLEVVITTYDGHVFAFEHDGKAVEGFPVRTDLSRSYGLTTPQRIVDHGFFAGPVLSDLDKDGNLEIIGAAMDQHIYVWRHNGARQPGWPVLVRDPKYPDRADRIVSMPAVGDINNDGMMDLVTGTNETFGAPGAENESRAYALHGDGHNHEGGAFHSGWPIKLYGLQDNVLPVVGRGTPNNPILADLDYDGTLEIAVEAISSTGNIYNHDGSEYRKLKNQPYGEFSDSEDLPMYMLINNSTFARFDNSGGIDLLKGGAGFGFAKTFVAGGKREYFDHHLGVWDTQDGKFLANWPRVMEDWQFFMNPVVVDLDNDKKVEAINSGGGYLVHAWNSDGVEPKGWPKTTGGWNICSAAVGDIDGDGNLDVATASRNGWLFVWKTQGSTDSIVEWQFYGHDHHNTGNYNTPLPLYGTSGSGPVDPPEDAGGTGGDDVVLDQDTGSGSDVGETVEEDSTLVADSKPTQDITESESPTNKKSDDGCQVNGEFGGRNLWLLLILLAIMIRYRRIRA